MMEYKINELYTLIGGSKSANNKKTRAKLVADESLGLTERWLDRSYQLIAVNAHFGVFIHPERMRPFIFPLKLMKAADETRARKLNDDVQAASE